MEGVPAQMVVDRHDGLSTTEAHASVGTLRALEAFCAAAGISAAAALAAFRVESTPVNVSELRGAYARTIARVAEIFDLATARNHEFLKLAAKHDDLAAECEAREEPDLEMAAQHRAEAEKCRREAEKCRRAAQAAANTLDVLHIGLRGLDRCRGMEHAHNTFPGGPAQHTGAYAQR